MQFNAFRLFLVDYVEAHVYTDKPATIDALKENIEKYIWAIPAEMLERVYQNWAKRTGQAERSRGRRAHERTCNN